MTTPGQQLDANTDTLALLQAKVQSLTESHSALEARHYKLVETVAALVASGDETVDIDPPAPDPEPTPPVLDLPAIISGTGWSGPTPVPEQIGSAIEPVIAHWNVVPEQGIENGFTPGVIAHHLDGIDRVEFAINGGPWTAVRTPKYNPRTVCKEYFAPVDLAAHDGSPLQLRAIAYPKTGKPVLVKPLGSEYKSQDLTLYPYEVGEVIEFDAGEHNLSARKLPETGWLTIRPKPGVNRQDVVIVGESRDWGRGRLKLQRLTFKLPTGNAAMKGKYMLDASGKAQIGNHVWFDDCVLEGAGIGPDKDDYTKWLAHQWETATYTDCDIRRIGKVFFSVRRIKNLVRNCYIEDTYEDVFNASGLMVNIDIDTIDRQPLNDAHGLDKDDQPHPDIWQSKTFKDTILQNVRAINNINAQGLFIQGSRVENVAVVGCDLRTQPPWRVFAPEVPITNWLIKDSNLEGGGSMKRASVAAGQRFVIDNVTDGDGPFVDETFNIPGVEVRA
ncbi:MAG: hypothetical protein EBY40_07680 [Marivivens sp.]|nr:hypothetical protein [Marivivens sp.]NBT51353.1 hypothetical protein [Marivivens sp.]NCW68882.1 hypothetical protein [Marivivens sp.]NDH02994.1 hypothetical protein [Marivivens sp.]